MPVQLLIPFRGDVFDACFPLVFTGQIHSATEPAPGPETDGPARRGLPLLQAHAGKRATRYPTHGDAARQKEIMRSEKRKHT